MKKINIEELINSKNPNLLNKYPKSIKQIILFLINLFFKENEINKYLELLQDKYNLDFIDSLFDLLDFSYIVSSKEKNRIPAEGCVLIVANHPLGALDGLSLLKAVGEVRSDVCIVANDLLINIENIKDLIIPIDYYTYSKNKLNLNRIKEAIKNDKAIILFPSKQVSRFTINGIKDKKWKKSVVKLATKYQIPVLPIYIDAKNSILFYLVSFISNRLSTFMLSYEILNKRSTNININIGKILSGNTFKNSKIDFETQIKLLKKHLYNIPKLGKGIFLTENTIIHPISKKQIKYELGLNSNIGLTTDNKKIYLIEPEQSPNIIKEIGRLREITFRKVGEGTGRTIDIDKYDNIYKHILLWDDEELEIVGSYRLGVISEILKEHGINMIYNSELFNFRDDFIPILNKSLELGRSFVQAKYWGSHALDYLWQGIAAYLTKNSDIKYLWGAVSISDTYHKDAKDMIVFYHLKWFKESNNYAAAKNPFSISEKNRIEFSKLFIGNSANEDFQILKKTLRNYNQSCPVLLRKYVELCNYGGASFIDFGIDENFANSIDCLILLDLDMLKEDFKKRYFKNLYKQEVEKV